MCKEINMRCVFTFAIFHVGAYKGVVSSSMMFYSESERVFYVNGLGIRELILQKVAVRYLFEITK